MTIRRPMFPDHIADHECILVLDFLLCILLSRRQQLTGVCQIFEHRAATNGLGRLKLKRQILDGLERRPESLLRTLVQTAQCIRHLSSAKVAIPPQEIK